MSEEQQKNKILLVDDDELLLDMYSRKFEEEGFEIHTAADGMQGLEKIRNEQFDALLIDLVMPEVDGFEVLKGINEEKIGEGAAVIVLSNQGTDEDVERAKEIGIDGYIVKASAVPSEVLEKVEEIIEAKQQQEE